MYKRHLILILLLVSLLYSCALSKSKNPQLTSVTVWALNTADQLQQAQNDYNIFFIDVGDAHRQGVLNAGQVETLNQIGYRAKVAIETANMAFKAWQSNPTDSQKQIIITTLNTVQIVLVELSTEKVKMIGGGAR